MKKLWLIAGVATVLLSAVVQDGCCGKHRDGQDRKICKKVKRVVVTKQAHSGKLCAFCANRGYIFEGIKNEANPLILMIKDALSVNVFSSNCRSDVVQFLFGIEKMNFETNVILKRMAQFIKSVATGDAAQDGELFASIDGYCYLLKKQRNEYREWKAGVFIILNAVLENILNGKKCG